MKKFRKKPVVIEAIQWDNESSTYDKIKKASRDMFERGDGHVRWSMTYESLIVSTLEGDMRADKGDWIIKGIHGELYPCKADIFEKTYEPVEE